MPFNLLSDRYLSLLTYYHTYVIVHTWTFLSISLIKSGYTFTNQIIIVHVKSVDLRLLIFQSGTLANLYGYLTAVFENHR